MSDPKAALIICSRLSDPERRAVPGAELRNCADCGAEVIIAPSTLARPELSNPSTRIVCLECGAPQLDGLVLYPPNERQKDELEAAGYDRESWPLRHAHGSVLKKVDFMPGDVVLHPLPLVGTMGRSELEVAAAMLVFALKAKGIGWQPILMGEVLRAIMDHLPNEPVASWASNPFLRPDFLGLESQGFVRRADHPDSIVFTLRGIEALRPHVKRPEVPNG